MRIPPTGGFVEVIDRQTRCVSNKCRSVYSANYVSKTGGLLRNKISGISACGKVLFTGTPTGIFPRMLATRYERTYRAGANPTSEESSMSRESFHSPENGAVHQSRGAPGRLSASECGIGRGS